jgi:hypothetical protein
VQHNAAAHRRVPGCRWTSGVDWPLHLCYRDHVPGTTPEHGFGGAWGYVDNGQLALNPATGAATCPAGYTATQVLGTNGTDGPCSSAGTDDSADGDARLSITA